MLADAEIPIRVPDPVRVDLALEIEAGAQIRPAQQLVENDAVVEALDPHLAAVALVKKIISPPCHLRQANGCDAQECFRAGKINPRVLFLRLDLQEHHVFGIGIAYDDTT